jgi:hypothetical protein
MKVVFSFWNIHETWIWSFLDGFGKPGANVASGFET